MSERTDDDRHVDRCVLALRGVEVAYGSFAVLRGVDLSLRAGESLALIGANGAGKSTVLKTIAGFLTPRRGSIRLAGDEIAGMRPHQVLGRGCAYVAQGEDFFPEMTVRENIAMGGYLLRDKRRVRSRLDECMDMFAVLRRKAKHVAGGLSGGERQQLKIARALMTEPRVLLLDEPSAGLAPAAVDGIFAEIDALRRDTEMGILLVEQNIVKALESANRTCVLELGVVVRSAAADEQAVHDIVRDLYLGTERERPPNVATKRQEGAT